MPKVIPMNDNRLNINMDEYARARGWLSFIERYMVPKVFTTLGLGSLSKFLRKI